MIRKDECEFKVGDKVRTTKQCVRMVGTEVRGTIEKIVNDVIIVKIEDDTHRLNKSWLEHDYDCDDIDVLSRINEMRKELIILEERVKCNDDCELRMEISDLVRRHRKDFKKEIEYWVNKLRENICEKGYDEALKRYDFIPGNTNTFEKTGLMCSRDILNGSNYSEKMRKKILKLFNKYGEKKILMIICEEAKKQSIGKY